jgi:hypothetical protein
MKKKAFSDWYINIVGTSLLLQLLEFLGEESDRLKAFNFFSNYSDYLFGNAKYEVEKHGKKKSYE